MKGIQFPALPRIEHELIKWIYMEIESLRDNFVVIDLTEMEDDIAPATVGQ